MTIERIGNYKYLYTFNLNEKEEFLKRLEKEIEKGGNIEERFISNGYAFEVYRINFI